MHFVPRFWGLICLTPLAFVGCQSDISADYYRASSVGSVNRAIRGKIVSVRTVRVSDESGVGASAGAATGAIAGASGSDNVAGAAVLAIAGAVAGGVAGATAEKSLTKQEALEYVIESENGALLSVVQGGGVRFAVGQSVIVLYGNPSRVIGVSSSGGGAP
jgi:outer membrane lipoprotein SlyB